MWITQIRGVEIGIVLIVLMVWAGAIALFFNRWGKIRMLLPYQPDYKHEQLKVPGTGVCSSGVCNGQHSHQVHSPGHNVSFINTLTQYRTRYHYTLHHLLSWLFHLSLSSVFHIHITFDQILIQRISVSVSPRTITI